MKLRIKGNSLRLRVTRLEVARLLSDGYVEEAVQLTAAPEAKLFYALRRDSSAARPAVQYAQNKVTVLLTFSPLSIFVGRDPGRCPRLG